MFLNFLYFSYNLAFNSILTQEKGIHLKTSNQSIIFGKKSIIVWVSKTLTRTKRENYFLKVMSFIRFDLKRVTLKLCKNGRMTLPESK